MKKLLMLLVFSATTFASAQRQFTVVELEASPGSTPPHERITHVYAGDREFDIPYDSDYQKVSTTTYTLHLNPTPSFLEYDGDSYIAGLSFLGDAHTTYARLGRHGRFFIPGGSGAQVSHELVLASSPYQILFDNGWTAGLQSLAGRRWNYRTPNCDATYTIAINEGGYVVWETKPEYPTGRTLLAVDEVPAGSHSIATTSSYESIEGSGGLGFVNLSDIVEAVQVRSDGICVLCVGTSTSIDVKYSLLNDGRTFSDYIPGVTDWIPTGLTNTEWNYVVDRRFHHEIHENTLAGTFTLYVNLLSGEGRNINLQTPRTFNCLEDLIAVLPQ